MLGATAWVGLWVLVGDLAGAHIETIYRKFQRYEKYVLAALVVVVIAVLVRWMLRQRQHRQTDWMNDS
jgi:membrane protein DedA with SNARE-associated domain